MKSAYERAMEKFGSETEPRKLTDAQKAEIAEINNRFEALIAERQTFLQSKIAQARGAGSYEEIAELESQLGRDVQALREEWEAKKSKVWNS